MQAIERRRRLKPVVAAIVIVASMVLGLVLAHLYSSTLPAPYGP